MVSGCGGVVASFRHPSSMTSNVTPQSSATLPEEGSGSAASRAEEVVHGATEEGRNGDARPGSVTTQSAVLVETGRDVVASPSSGLAVRGGMKTSVSSSGEGSGASGARQKNNVRKIRIERMMSKAELARRANLSVLTIDRIEKGFGCRMDTKRKILEALGLSLDDRVRVFGEEE
jgi:DNA-binding XRE family transcriptional regulator